MWECENVKMWKCDECAGSRHFERSPPEADEVRNLVPFIGTKYSGTGIIYLDLNV